LTSVKSLRIAVFGVPRSGKDFSIMKVIEAMNEQGMELIHYPGVPTARSYSPQVLGKEFSCTTMEEKGRLMEIFRKKISDRELIKFLIQDEHYCFPVLYGGKPIVNDYTSAKFPFVLKMDSGGFHEYEVILKEEWITDCDMVFYLCPDPEAILERMSNSEGAKRNTQITAEDIESWMEFEVDSLKEVCSWYGLSFEVLGGNNGAYERIIHRICEAMNFQTVNITNSSPEEGQKIIGKWES